MFFDRLLAFDHVRHQIHIIATADVAQASSRAAPTSAPRATLRNWNASWLAACRAATWPPPTAAPERKIKPKSSTSRAGFLRAVRRAKEYIAAGDIFQVVLSQRLSFDSAARSRSTFTVRCAP